MARHWRLLPSPPLIHTITSTAIHLIGLQSAVCSQPHEPQQQHPTRSTVDTNTASYPVRRDNNSNSGGDADLFPSSSHSVREFVAGTAGGFAGKLLDYPLDTVKVLLQTQQQQSTGKQVVQYRGAWHCLTHTLRTNGIAGLYQGISSPLLGSMAENALLFWAYHHCQVAIVEWQNHNRATSVKTLDDLTVWQRAVAGAGAGAVVPLVLTPVELIKCRLQVQNNPAEAANFVHYKGPLHVIGHTLRHEGLLGLYRGFGPTVAREIPGNFVWYGVYEGVCLLFTRDTHHPRDQVPAYAHLLGGAAAGIGYWTAFYPADTVKSRMQTTPNGVGMSFWETFWHIYRKEGGVRALYRGWGVTCLRAAPAHAAIFGVYEQVLKVWN